MQYRNSYFLVEDDYRHKWWDECLILSMSKLRKTEGMPEGPDF